MAESSRAGQPAARPPAAGEPAAALPPWPEASGTGGAGGEAAAGEERTAGDPDPEAGGAGDPGDPGGESGSWASPWAGVELPPTATSRRRRKRGHRGGVGRRGGRRVSQPNPEDDPLYPFKVQAAKDLGLWPKVEREGWGALTSLESGRIGGYMQRLVREAQAEGRIPPGLIQGRIPPASTES